MLGTVFHYAVMEPRQDHSECFAQRNQVIAMHERMGYRSGGAYNGHFCIHGESWVSYTGPNQATGDTWANLNLHAWCYLATVDTPVTDAAAQAAYDLTLFEPTGRDQIYPHSAFFPTSCCGDPLRDWISRGANPPAQEAPKPKEDTMRLIRNTDNDQWFLFTDSGWEQNVSPDRVWNLAAGGGVPAGAMAGGDIFALAVSINKINEARRAEMVKALQDAGLVAPGGGGQVPANVATKADVAASTQTIVSAVKAPRSVSGQVL